MKMSKKKSGPSKEEKNFDSAKFINENAKKDLGKLEKIIEKTTKESEKEEKKNSDIYLEK